jgi:serine/threonine-protein kinase
VAEPLHKVGGAHSIAQDGETLVAVDPPGGSPGSVIIASAAAPSSALSGAQPGSGERHVLGDRYEILALLGSGGMGTVYRARDLELDEIVALKVLRRELLSAEGIVDRFRREAKLARRVTHRNVARVFDIGEHEGEKFLTMEFVEGESLAAAIAREGALSVTRAVEVASAIAAGLASAHAAGVVHRDLKPDNVLLASDGRVVLTDFGIARAIAGAGPAATMGGLVGTPAYMAPEQVEGRSDVDARADLYALGALMFELFTGHRAWPGDAIFVVAAARLTSPPPDPRARRPDLPAPAADLIVRCLARRPEDRPASAEEVASVLATITLPPKAAHAPAAPTLAAQGHGARDMTPVTPAAHAAGKTVAVLPFRNAGAPDDDYLAEELTDDLIDALSMTRGLKVRARGAVMRFKGAERDPRDVGRELDVQVVVEGSVRRARGSVRVSARLVSVADGFQLWAKRFDRPEHDVLAINDEAARAIAGALTVDAAAAARNAPSDPAAIDLYIRGRHEYRKFWPDAVERAIGLFDQALVIAPEDPTILAGLATALARRVFFRGDDGFVRAREVAERAVAAAPNLGEPHLALGSVLLQNGETPAAVRAFKRAVQKSPGLAEAHASLGRMLMEAGAVDEGVRRLEAALALDADAPLARPELARGLALMGEWARADAECDKLLEKVSPISHWTVRGRLALWRRDEATTERFIAQMDAHADAMATQLPRMIVEVIRQRKLPEIAVSLDEEERASPGGVRRRVFMHQLRGEILGYLGHLPEALASMERSAAEGLVDLLWLERCPLFEELRQDARYLAIHAQVKRRADEILAAYRNG